MSDKCPVCLSELGEKNIFTTRCGHTFCGSCIIENLNYTTKCPMCRQSLSESGAHGGVPGNARGDMSNTENLRTVYSDLIVDYLISAEGAGGAEGAEGGQNMRLRAMVHSLLGGFESELRVFELHSPLSRERPLSVSDLTFELNSDLDEVDQIIANIDIDINIPE